MSLFPRCDPDVRLNLPLWQTAKMRHVGIWVIVLTGLVAVVVLGFRTGVEPMTPYDRYQSRLQNLLGEPQLVFAEKLPRMPRRRELQLPIAAAQIDLIDYAKLHQCDLGDLASLRQGPLGQVMPASQRLVLDLRWLQEGPPCVAQGAAWLQPILIQKRAQISAMYWNAVVAGPEFSALMSLASSSTLR